MHGDLSANKEESQRDPSRLEQKAWGQKSGDQEARLGVWEDPDLGQGPGCTTGVRAEEIGVQLWLGGQTQAHDHWRQVRLQARLCPRGTGQSAHPVICPHLALPRASAINVLQAKYPRGAPPDVCLLMLFASQFFFHLSCCCEAKLSILFGGVDPSHLCNLGADS